MSVPVEKLETTPSLFAEAKRQLEVAEHYTITSSAEYEQADIDLSDVITLHKKLDAMRKDEKKPHDDAGKAVQAKYKEPLDFLVKAKEKLKNTMCTYQEEEEERARKAAEEEAMRIQRNAEKRAETATKNGDNDAAHAIVQEAAIEAHTAKAAISTSTTKTKVTKRDKYEAVLIDLKMLLQAILDGRAPLHIVALNQSEANKYAQAMKGSVTVPGLAFKNVGSVVAGRRK
jgi:thiol:disulfide interchange protein